MKRREFITCGSLSLAALAVNDKWLDSVIAGEAASGAAARGTILETYFQVSRAEIDKRLAAALSKGADFADVFFEYRVTSNLSGA